MKILHVLNELKFSGAEIMYVDAAKNFQQLGCKLYVLNTSTKLGDFSDFFCKAGYQVLHKPYPKNFYQRIRYYNEIIQFIKNEKIDVIHTHRASMKFGMAYCAWKAHCKSIYTFHNVFKSHWYSYPINFLQRWIAKHIFKCTFQTISDSVYNNEKKYYFNNSIKIYNWYGDTRFYPAKLNEKETIRQKLNIPLDSLVIISVGGCSPIKRHTDIIKALPQIIKQYPNTIYLHLGEGKSLEEERKLAQELNVQEYIRFYGNQSNVRKFLIASDLYLMPSKHEGIPITTIECMACKIPTILYNVPGLCDFNKENECSILIPENYKILAQTVISLYENKNQQRTITDNAYTFVNKYFNMTENSTKIFELYSNN